MITSTYKDILLELDLLEVLQVDLIRQLHQNHRVIWTGMAPSDPMPVHVPLDKALASRENIVERLLAIQSEIQIKHQLKKQIEDGLQQMSGVHHKIFYMRDIEGKTLKQIALELGYTHGWIRQLVSKYEQTTNTTIAKS